MMVSLSVVSGITTALKPSYRTVQFFGSISHQLHLRFEDSVDGTIDLNQIIEFSGVFAALRDPDYFATVQVDTEIGTIGWPNGADLDPDVLYSIVTQQPIPDYGSLERT
jgi:hypothetical protein